MGARDGGRRPEHAVGPRRALATGQGRGNGSPDDDVLIDDLHVVHVDDVDHDNLDDHRTGNVHVVNGSFFDDVVVNGSSVVVNGSFFDVNGSFFDVIDDDNHHDVIGYFHHARFGSGRMTLKVASAAERVARS